MGLNPAVCCNSVQPLGHVAWPFCLAGFAGTAEPGSGHFTWPSVAQSQINGVFQWTDICAFKSILLHPLLSLSLS